MQVRPITKLGGCASCAIAALFVATPALAQKVPEVRLNTNGAGSSLCVSPQIASVASSAYVVWQDSRNGAYDIYLNRSIDGGMSWLEADRRLDTDAPGAANSLSPQIATSGSSVYVTWNDSRNGYGDIYFTRSLDGGATWLATDVRLDTDAPGAAPSAYQQIAASGSTVGVVWMDGRNGKNDIYFNRSVDGGTTWLAPDLRLDTDPPGAADSTNPQIAAFGSSIYVTWADTRNGNWDIYFNRSLDAGATWLASDVRLDTDAPGAANSFNPQIATSSPSVYVVWQDWRNGNDDIYFNRSLNSGVGWLLADVRIDTDPAGSAYSTHPQMELSRSSLNVVWADTRNGYSDIYFNRSLDDGATWLATDVRLDTDPPGAALSNSPQLATSASSVYVVWKDWRSVFTDIYLNRSLDDGATWLATDVQLDTAFPGRTTGPVVAASEPSAYVAWSDERAGYDDIYFNQPSGFLSYGPSLAGSGGIPPRLVGAGRTTIGDVMTLDVSSGLGGASGALLLGNQQALTSVLGGTLLVVPVVHIPLQLGGSPGLAGTGSGSLPISIPNNPALVGATANVQAVFFDNGAVSGISMTAGLEFWIG